MAQCSYFALPAFAGPFTDVPTDHWAYDAIDKLQSEGFVEGYPDGTFRGNRSFTRYEMAMVVARIWDRLSSELTTMEGKIPPPGVSEDKLQEELKLVYNLMDEFKKDLAGMSTRMDDCEKRINGLETRVTALENNTNGVKFSGALRTRIEDIVTNEYAGSGALPPVGWVGTPGTGPGETFEVEEKIQLAMQAHPSDYLDVYMDMWQIASYLRNPVKGLQTTLPPNQPLVIDQAYAKADMMKLMGWTPSQLFKRFNLTVGDQYARFGEFGLAFDNGYETRPGVAIDIGGNRLGLSAFLAQVLILTPGFRKVLALPARAGHSARAIPANPRGSYLSPASDSTIWRPV